MYPGLKTTRSIGDLLAHQIGVTSEPNFDSQQISSEKCFVLGTPGLFDTLPKKVIIDEILDSVD